MRIENRAPDTADRNRLDILNACLDIAASSVTNYPYGLKERFTAEEKECYRRLEEVLAGRGTER